MATDSTIQPATQPAPGWKGGFLESHPQCAYPDAELSSLPMTGNMDNIGLLKRQLDVLWPEFSWRTDIKREASRCYRMFAPDISRLGYDDFGQMWSVICPQQGFESPTLGSFNSEVTVTGQRGWVDETVKDREYDLLAADITVTVKIWFGPSAKDKLAYKILAMIFEEENLPFPLDKAHAILIQTHKVSHPLEPNLPLRAGVDKNIKNPDFAIHPDAWAVAHVAVEIGQVQSLNNQIVDDFNAMIVDIFNIGSGNMLQPGGVLNWNLWFDAPTHVDQKEWRDHAEFWRRSIDTGHGSPDGEGRASRYFDGGSFEPIDAVVKAEWDKIRAWLKAHRPTFLTLIAGSAPRAASRR